MAELALRHLVDDGVRSILVANRSHDARWPWRSSSRRAVTSIRFTGRCWKPTS